MGVCPQLPILHLPLRLNAITHFYSFCPGAPTIRSCTCASNNNTSPPSILHPNHAAHHPTLLRTPHRHHPVRPSHTLLHTPDCTRQSTPPTPRHDTNKGREVCWKHGPSAFVDTQTQAADTNNAVPDSCQNSSSTTTTTGASVRTSTQTSPRAPNPRQHPHCIPHLSPYNTRTNPRPYRHRRHVAAHPRPTTIPD